LGKVTLGLGQERRNRYAPPAVAIFLSGLVVIAASVLFFILSLGRPFMGVVLSRDAQGWMVRMVDANGVEAAAGIKVGDRAVEIDGQPVGGFLKKYESAGTFFAIGVRELSVTSGDGSTKTAVLKGASLSWESLTEQVSRFIISLIFWIVGFYVLIRKPKNVAACLLYLCGLVVGLALSANQAGAIGVPSALPVAAGAVVVGPWLLAHFFLVLPEGRSALRRDWRVYLVYLPAVATLALLPFIGIANGQPLPGFRTLRLFEVAAGFVVVVGIAIYNYAGGVSHRTRQQMKIVLISCLAALVPLLLLNVLPQILWQQPVVPPGFSFLFVALIPLGMGYAVVTQRLMDIDVIVRRGIIYGLVTIVMAAILSSAIVVSARFVSAMTLGQEIVMALVLGAIAAVLFGPVKHGIETFVDRTLYKDRYDYRQIVHGLSTSLNLTKDLNELARLVVGTAVQALNLAGACLVVTSEAGAEVAASQGNLADPDRQKRAVTLALERRPGIEFPESALTADPELAYLIPLAAGGKEVGVLCLAPKASRQDFSSDDAYLLQGLASVAAGALRSALLARDVSARDTFVSVASHELRSPLTSIVGFADLLVRRDPPEEMRRKWAKSIYDNSQRISEMVDELLNVSRIRSGRLSLKLEPVDVGGVVWEQVNVARETTDKHEFVVDLAPDLPLAQADRDKFGHILRNLLSNAVKYSPAGGRITVSAYLDSARQIMISVADQGIGIGPADRGSLFTTFHRIHRPETQSIPGSGLGLYIVKEWTEAMGGHIWLESELDKGSVFFMTVPASDAAIEEGDEAVLDQVPPHEHREDTGR